MIPDAADRRIAAALFALVAAVLLAVVFDAHDGNTDAEIHFQQARAMATRGSWAFEPDRLVTDRIIQLESMPGAAGSASQKGVDGRVYGHFGPAYVLAATPLYAIGAALAVAFPGIEVHTREREYLIANVGGPLVDYLPRLVVGAISPLFLALGAACVYLAGRRLGAGRWPACMAALALPFATFAGPIARHCGSDTMAAALVAVALERALARRFAEAGAAAALVPATRYLGFSSLPGVALVLLVVALREERSARAKALAAAALPFLAVLAAILVVNHLRWGSPFDFGYRHTFEDDDVLVGDRVRQTARGLFLSFFAPSRGLVFFAAPLVVLGVAGLFVLARRDRPLAIALAVGIVAVVIPPSASILWHGTWSWGPRYHLPALVYLAGP
ncbi:MAG TPA: hypothetical protein VKE69_11305, partial [Planctomycetota bacterium]|nr:hypothetical protein [Planctomycetota bacterium]